MIILSALMAFAANSAAGLETPLDLSKDLVEASKNDGATKLIEEVLASQESPLYREALRTFTVVEHGKIVASYVRDDADPNDPLEIYSLSKCVFTLLIGILVDQGLLSLDETIGSIFTDESVWASLANHTEEEVAYKKSVTVQELLTMTSGMVCPDPNCVPSCPNGGEDLTDALSCPAIVPGGRGSLAYLTTNNILSYVLKEKTGSTPREFLAANVLPALGIDDASIDWRENNDGVELSGTGLYLTAHQMAKIGLLHQQDGFSAPGKTVVSEDWIKTTLSDVLFADVWGHNVGYTNWVVPATVLDLPEAELGRIVCGQGAFGQVMCLCSPELDRLFVLQTDEHDGLPGRKLQTFNQVNSAAVACNRTLSFDTSPPPAAAPSPMADPATSGAVLASHLKKSVGVLILFGSLFSWLL